jgi:hypothetical protein
LFPDFSWGAWQKGEEKMKKILVIAIAILLVFSTAAMALEPVNYVEDVASLPDNEWTHEEAYTFFGGLELEPGTYDLVFELHGTALCQVNGNSCSWGDAGDEIRVQALVDGNEVASTIKSDLS